MSKRTKTILFVLAGLLVLGTLVLQIPRVKSAVDANIIRIATDNYSCCNDIPISENIYSGHTASAPAQIHVLDAFHFVPTSNQGQPSGVVTLIMFE